jgi:hypothetical protein
LAANWSWAGAIVVVGIIGKSKPISRRVGEMNFFSAGSEGAEVEAVRS